MGNVDSSDLTGQECRVRHTTTIIVDVLCNACEDAEPTTWEDPYDNSCGKNKDDVTLSCHGSFGQPIEKWCREALNATTCDHNSVCTGDEKCLFDADGKTFYYGTCRTDDFVIGEGWIVLFSVLGFIALLLLWRIYGRKKVPIRPVRRSRIDFDNF